MIPAPSASPATASSKRLALLLGSLLALAACSTPQTADTGLEPAGPAPVEKIDLAKLAAEAEAAGAASPAAESAQVAEAETAAQAPAEPAPAVAPGEASLLFMNFEEAKAISPQNAQVGPLFKVAADSVEVLKSDRQGNPVKVRAKGHVFLELGLPERAMGMCEEALVTTREVRMTGQPMIRQAGKVARATAEKTEFWVRYDLFQSFGPHEFINMGPASF